MTLNGSLKTDDLAAAAYLISMGFDYTLSRSIRDHKGFMTPTCQWTFSKEAAKAMGIYRRGEARVDPNKFVRTLGAVRREMYAFLDV
jgi:hypothetical protein